MVFSFSKTVSRLSTFKLVAFILVGLFVSSCSLNKSLEAQYQKVTKNGPYDAVIIPGAPLGDKSLSTILAARIMWAKYLYDNKIAKNIIFSGAAVHTPYVEAMVMQIYADSLGLPREHTFAETKAKHSTENAYYGMQMAKQLGFKKVAVATDIFQTILLNNFLKRRCERMVSVPVVFKRIYKNRKTPPILPIIDVTAAHVDEADFIPLNDKENFFKRLSGTLGLQINFKEVQQPIAAVYLNCDSVDLAARK